MEQMEKVILYCEFVPVKDPNMTKGRFLCEPACAQEKTYAST